MKRPLIVEPADNGWIVIEPHEHEPAQEDDEHGEDEDGQPGYDPSAAFAGRERGPRRKPCQKDKVRVFTDHKKLIAFLTEATKGPGSTTS